MKTKLAYLLLGLMAGVLLAGRGPSGAIAARLLAACGTPPGHHGPALPFAVDHTSGMSVQASHLRVDTVTDPDLQPKKGDVYMVVHLLIHNGGKKPHDYNALDFHLHGSADQQNYSGDAIDPNINNTALSAGSLAPGAFIAGDVAFEVPNNHQMYTLLWDAEFDSPALNVPLNR